MSATATAAAAPAAITVIDPKLQEQARLVEEALGKLRDRASQVAVAARASFQEFAGQAVQAAMTASDALSEFGNAFRGVDASMERFTSEFASGMGFARSEAEQTATALGLIAVPLAKSAEEAGVMTRGMTQLAGQIAKVRHISLQDAAKMVEAGVQGSSNELRQFGISLTDAAVRTEKLRSGITGEFEELSEASQAQIRYNLIIGQSAKLVEQASHAFNDPSAHLAVLSAHFQDLVQAIGSRLLPVYIKLIDALDWGVRSFNRLGSGAKTAITALAVAVPALGAIGTAIASLSSAAGVIRLAFAPILAGVEAALGGIGAVAGAVFSGLGAAVAAAVLSITALVLVVHHFHADLGLIVSDMAATVRGWLGKLADGIKWYLDQEKEIWGETFDQIAKGVGEAIKSILGKLAEVQDFMASHGLADKNGDDLRRMAAEVDTFGEKFKDASTQAWTMMKEVGASTWKDLTTRGQATWEEIVKGASKASSAIGDEFKSIGKDLGLDTLVKKLTDPTVLAETPPDLKKTKTTANFDKVQASRQFRRDFNSMFDQFFDTRDTASKDQQKDSERKKASHALDFQRTIAEDNARLQHEASTEAADRLRDAYQNGTAEQVRKAEEAAKLTRAAADAADESLITATKAVVQAADDSAKQMGSDAAKAMADSLEAASDAGALGQKADRTHNDDDRDRANKALQKATDLQNAAFQKAQEAREAELSVVQLREDGARKEADIRHAWLQDEKENIKARRAYEKALGQAARDWATDPLTKVAAPVSGMVDAGKKGFDLFSHVAGNGQFAAAAGPIGAAVGAVIALLEQSKQFQELSSKVGDLVQKVADTVGEIIAPFNSLLDVVSLLTPLLKPLGPVFRQLAYAIPSWGPVLQLADFLQPAAVALAPLGELFGKMYDAISSLMPGALAMAGLAGGATEFTQALKPLSDGLDKGVDAIRGVLPTSMVAFNTLRTLFGSGFQKLGGELAKVGAIFAKGISPFLGLFVKLVYRLADMVAATGLFDGALHHAFDAIKGSARAALTVAFTLGQVWNAALTAFSGMVATIRSATGGDHSPFASELTNLQNSLNGLQVDVSPLSQALDALAQVTWQNADATEAATDETQKSSQAAQEVSEALSNVPEAYKVAQARDRALAGSAGKGDGSGGGSSTGPATGGNSTSGGPPELSKLGRQLWNSDREVAAGFGSGLHMNARPGENPGWGESRGGLEISGPVTIVANDPKEFFGALESMARRKQYTLTGSLGRFQGSRLVTSES